MRHFILFALLALCGCQTGAIRFKAHYTGPLHSAGVELEWERQR